MSHFTTLVIVAPSVTNIEAKVEELMMPYYSEMEVEPYKYYLEPEELAKEVNDLKSLSPEQIKKLTNLFLGEETNDLERLAKLKLGWFDDWIDGTDEKGEYIIRNCNPNGKWDSYIILEPEEEAQLSISFPRKVKEIPDVIAYAIVTPDGKWYDMGIRAGIEAFVRTEIRQETGMSEDEMIWADKVREIKSLFPDYLAVPLDCHI